MKIWITNKIQSLESWLNSFDRTDPALERTFIAATIHVSAKKTKTPIFKAMFIAMAKGACGPRPRATSTNPWAPDSGHGSLCSISKQGWDFDEIREIDDTPTGP